MKHLCQLAIRDEEVERLNGKVRTLHGEIRELQTQLEFKDEKVHSRKKGRDKRFQTYLLQGILSWFD